MNRHAALVAVCASGIHDTGAFEHAGQDTAAAVSTSFNLYGNSVEPFDDSKQSALKTAVAQSAGHGVTADNVQISVDATYADQSKVLPGQFVRLHMSLNVCARAGDATGCQSTA